MGISACELQSARIFSGLPARELEVIARSGAVTTIPANTVFMREGELSASLYVILSGRVKVYAIDPHGREHELSERGVGDHLGEIAMLGDSVRTASVATLEESRFLVLSRRPFMECLARNPEIGLNLDDARVVRRMRSEIGPQAADRYRAWSAFRRSGLPLILLIGGCTGTGKSTVAAELSLRMDIGRTQSTDILREVMRVLLPEPSEPVLFASTYEAWKAVPAAAAGKALDHGAAVAGFLAQANRVTEVIDGVVRRSIKEQVSMVVEGIHLHPEYHRRFTGWDAVVVPVLLTVPSRDDLKAHFARRGEQAPSRGARRYLEHLDNILELQDYFVAEARRHGVDTIANDRVDRTVERVMDVITARLMRRFAKTGGGD